MPILMADHAGTGEVVSAGGGETTPMPYARKIIAHLNGMLAVGGGTIASCQDAYDDALGPHGETLSQYYAGRR